ncbi:MAG: 4Fe-4S binding protein [Deferrisomatales bacterium]
MRRWVQAASAVLQNAYLAFPWTRSLYQGPLKQLCTPGLNCYSCPAAVLSCPLGALQHFLGAVRPALRWGTYRVGFYVVGLLAAVGLVAGRFPCGWLCPFGWLQDGLHKLPSPKLAVPRALTALRYPVLAVLVVLLPLWATAPMGYGEAWFCRLLCPAGTLEAGALFFLIPELREQIGGVFAWKLAVLLAVVAWAVTSYRPYCRTLCPLGAIYGQFNRWSLLAVEWDPSLCTDCRACVEGCEVELDPRRDPRSPACLRCFGCAVKRCPAGALSVRLGAHTFRPRPCAPPSTPAS